ncbi:MAG: DUF475 domain-containing protein [Opitutales bacterium]|nr:DUF475 domain-containing protein [Opitutales bacterium]
MLKHFKWSLICVAVGLALAYLRGVEVGQPGVAFMFTAFAISLLEVAISFDNAVVNAHKLEKMDKIWRRRFLTWGIFVAVFGMRFLFPLLIVAIFAHLSIFSVIKIAFANPDEYVKHLHETHAAIVSFGGMFLLMLFLKFFIDGKKEIHWIGFLERGVKKLSRVKFISEIVAAAVLGTLVYFLPESEREVCAVSGAVGVALFLAIDFIAHFLESRHIGEGAAKLTGTAGFAMFMYLELIDASFSLDGVLGAFAFTKDIVVIIVGLGVGAMFVRSLTLVLVEKQTLSKLKYLTNGAYWAIGALSLVMLRSAVEEVPEAIAAGLSIGVIAISLVHSILENGRSAKP